MAPCMLLFIFACILSLYDKKIPAFGYIITNNISLNNNVLCLMLNVCADAIVENQEVNL